MCCSKPNAPLWLFVACDELMKAQKNKKLLKADCGDGRTVKEVLVSLATGLINGTENGITFDWDSGLIYSPSHYTWMDTNYPAGTPRQGYPIASGDRTVGKVCSGSISPTLSKSGTPTNIATAYVEDALAAVGTELSFVVRDKAEPCVVTELPFYKRAR